VISFPQGEEYLLERGKDEAVIPVIVKANPPAQVEWRFKDAPLRRPVNDFSLRFMAVSDYDAGVYTIIASNGVGEAQSASIRVIVYPILPVISLKVDKTIFVPGSDIELPCLVRGYPIPAVTWQKTSYRKPTTDLISDNVHTLIETYHESTLEIHSKLILRNVDDADTAVYTCRVETGSSQQPVSQRVSVSVQYGPGEQCVDSITFRNCPYVVRNRLCHKKYFGRMCCRSCVASGYRAG